MESLPDLLKEGEIDAFSGRFALVRVTRALVGERGITFEQPGLVDVSANMVAMNAFLQEHPDLIQGLLRAMLNAEKFAATNQGEAIRITAKSLRFHESLLWNMWSSLDLSVSLRQPFLDLLRERALWAIENRYTTTPLVPNYREFIHPEALKNIKPEVVTF